MDLETSSTERSTAATKQILVVEDDVDLGSVLVWIIRQETSYQAIHASTGMAALNIVSSLHCDMFLLDYQLPYMNGLELYDRLHTMPGHTGTPAIFLSASTRLPVEEITKRHLKYLYKPVEIDHLLDLVEATLNTEEKKS